MKTIDFTYSSIESKHGSELETGMRVWYQTDISQKLVPAIFLGYTDNVVSLEVYDEDFEMLIETMVGIPCRATVSLATLPVLSKEYQMSVPENSQPQQEPEDELAQFLLDHQAQHPPQTPPKVSRSLLDKILRRV